MKNFTFSLGRSIPKIIVTISLMLLFSSPLFAQKGWHNGNDSTFFKHHVRHRIINDSIWAHHVNDSISYHCGFDSILANQIHEWRDTIFFHRWKRDTSFAGNFRERIDSIDSLRRIKLDSFVHHLHRRFDTICSRHDWNDTTLGWKKGNDTIVDSICSHHWLDTILARRHRGYIVFYHEVRFWNTVVVNHKVSTIEDATISAGSPSNGSFNSFLPPSVNVYPNPLNSNATVTISNSSQPLNFRLFDAAGNMVISMDNLSNGNVQLNRNTLPPGMYFYQVLNNKSVVSTGKLVFQ